MSVQTPIVNAGLLYVNGLTTGTDGSTAIVQVSQGAARDINNINDLVLNDYTFINGDVVGPNGVDLAPVIGNTIYGVYVIGDSTGYKKTCCILSKNIPGGGSYTVSLPLGYDMFRRIGWAQTNTSAKFYKWYQFGAGQNRVYYFDEPIIAGLTLNSTTYAAVDAKVPPLNTQAIYKYNYIPALATSDAQFMPFGSPQAALGSAGIISVGSGVAASQKGLVELPVIYNPLTTSSQFLYRVSANDSLTISAIGFYDDLD